MAFAPLILNQVGTPDTVEFIPSYFGAYFRFFPSSYPVAALDQNFGSDGVFHPAFGIGDATGYGFGLLDTAEGVITRIDEGVTSSQSNIYAWTDGVNIKSAFQSSDFTDYFISHVDGVIGVSLDTYPHFIFPVIGLQTIQQQGGLYDGAEFVSLISYGPTDDREKYLVKSDSAGADVIGPFVSMTDADNDRFSGFNFMRQSGGYYYILSRDSLYLLRVAIDGSTVDEYIVTPSGGDLDLSTFTWIGASDDLFIAAGRDNGDGESVLLFFTPALDGYTRTNIFDFFLPDGAHIFADNSVAYTNFDIMGTFIPYAPFVPQAAAVNLKIGDGIKLPCYSPCTPVIIKEDYSL